MVSFVLFKLFFNWLKFCRNELNKQELLLRFITYDLYKSLLKDQAKQYAVNSLCFVNYLRYHRGQQVYIESKETGKIR